MLLVVPRYTQDLAVSDKNKQVKGQGTDEQHQKDDYEEVGSHASTLSFRPRLRLFHAF
jgi:hypothetical protein